MDLLKRSLAPVTDEAWEEVQRAVSQALKTQLSARKVVDVSEPGGWGLAAVGTGRLAIPQQKAAGDVRYGIHVVKPLIEARTTFSLELSELDAVSRGARDVDLAAAETAAKSLAEFEDGAIFNGFEPAAVGGIREASPHGPMALGRESGPYLDSVARGVLALRDGGVEGPYALVVGTVAFRRLMAASAGYPLKREVERLIDGKIVFSTVVDGAFLLSVRGGDLEMTLGQDISLGYESHGEGRVSLFLAETFTFRVLDPSVIVRYTVE